MLEDIKTENAQPQAEENIDNKIKKFFLSYE